MNEFTLGFLIGGILTWFFYRIMIMVATKHAKQQIESLMQTIQDQSKNIIQARVELHQGVFYVYNAQDNSFLAQGINMAELRQRIESRWQDATVYVTEGDADVLQALKSTGPDLETRRA